jgi:CheY-like chemotaxis protein
MNNSKTRLEVLFVDDEEQTLKYLANAFSSICQVRLAASVKEATQVLEQSPNVAVVVTDQMMPGGLGTELLQWVSMNRPHIVRILTTAYASLDAAIASINRGEVFRFVEKPWALDDLEALVLEAIERFQQRLAPEDYPSVGDEIILHNITGQVIHDCEGWKLYAMHSLDRLSDYEAGIEAIANKYINTLQQYLPGPRAELILGELDQFIDDRYLSHAALAQVQVAVSQSFKIDTNH